MLKKRKLGWRDILIGGSFLVSTIAAIIAGKTVSMVASDMGLEYAAVLGSAAGYCVWCIYFLLIVIAILLHEQKN